MMCPNHFPSTHTCAKTIFRCAKTIFTCVFCDIEHVFTYLDSLSSFKVRENALDFVMIAIHSYWNPRLVLLVLTDFPSTQRCAKTHRSSQIVIQSAPPSTRQC